ncbi:MAG: hypothetical protein Kow0089_19880 [Desulfobulbaceae bacterium]
MKSRPMKIVFLMSMPRSGSTLIQRVLAGHSAVATRTEPWLLLPLLYMTRGGVFSEYAHRHSSRAVREFIASVPDGEKRFDRCVRTFVYSMYEAACTGQEDYFLDKSPRYSLIADHLLEVFPEEKFILVWRNPLSLVSSIIRTWSRDRFFFWGSMTDLYEGFETLFNAWVANPERFLALRYEDFVQDSETTLRKITTYLDVEYDPALLEKFHETSLDGFYGDKTGYERYRAIDSEPARKWKETIDNPFRKYWCRKYLEWIGRERLAAMGYSLDELLDELRGNPSRKPWRTVTDFLYYCGATLVRLFEPFVFLYKVRKIKNGITRLPFLS